MKWEIFSLTLLSLQNDGLILEPIEVSNFKLGLILVQTEFEIFWLGFISLKSKILISENGLIAV